MYDTVNNWLDKEKVGYTNLLSAIPPLLTNVKETFCSTSQQISFTGNLKNYRVIVKERGVFLTGSLCKYYLNDNMQTLDRRRTEEAIDMLSDELHLPIAEAKVTRLDIAENLLMCYKVPYYFPYLGQSGRFTRLEQNNGVYYRLGNREMLFYGKLHEQRLKGVPIPEIMLNRNVLRYELRFKNRLCKQFNRFEVLNSTLFEEEFYMEMLTRWRDTYLSIHKHRNSSFNLNTLNSMKDFEKQIFLLGIQSLGGESAMMQIIEQAKQRGMFKYNMDVKRIKDKVKKVCANPKLTEESDAILELDKKVVEAIRHYR
jgi:hypothetical protein